MSLVTEVSDLATAMGTEIKDVRTDFAGVTGSLASLDTTDKATLVAAINEVLGVAEAGGSSGVTNLSASRAATTVTVASDTGTDATIVAADGTNAGVMTNAMYTKLNGIEAAADVTDATNVDAAGAVMNADTSTASMSFVVDEDDMVSNLATKVPTQQSVKAHVAAAIAALIDGAPGDLDTINELAAALGDDANAISAINTALSNRVRHDTAAQGLNGTQQANARTNIDVYSKAEIGDINTDLVAVFNAALT